MNSRIFAGVYPTGVVYSDRRREEDGDYARLAYLSFATLQLEFAKSCPKQLRAEIVQDAAKIQARQGNAYQVSTCGQSVILGNAAARV
jgi:hypothetical protein